MVWGQGGTVKEGPSVFVFCLFFLFSPSIIVDSCVSCVPCSFHIQSPGEWSPSHWLPVLSPAQVSLRWFLGQRDVLSYLASLLSQTCSQPLLREPRLLVIRSAVQRHGCRVCFPLWG